LLGEVTLPYTTSNFFCSGTDFSLCSPPRREPPTNSQFAPDKSDRLCRGGACPALRNEASLELPRPILQSSAGRNSWTELRSPSPTSCTNEVTLPRAIPASQQHSHSWLRSFYFRWELSVRVNCFELLLLAKQAGFEAATSPIRIRALSWIEVTRAFTTPESLSIANPCGGNRRPRSCCLSAALPLSYSHFHRWWESNPRLSDPDVTQAFTTPQTL
jgi:hypothetical protein